MEIGDTVGPRNSERRDSGTERTRVEPVETVGRRDYGTEIQ